MKKYFINNGSEQQGPFDLEDLKSRMIKKETSIWYEGLPDWTTADKVEDLKDLFKTVNPPPFKQPTSTPPPIQLAPPHSKNVPHQTTKKKNSGPTIYTIVGVILLIGVAIVVVNNMNSNERSGAGTTGNTYQEKVMSVEETERSQPTRFLKASGTYNFNFIATKVKVHGVITNNATVATYKDAVVKITYFSQTKTALGSENYTIYNTFPPQSERSFELKVDNYKDVGSIGLDILEAIPN